MAKFDLLKWTELSVALILKDAAVHSIRHTFGTHHGAMGTDLKTVQKTMRHADLSTKTIYVSLAKKAQSKALRGQLYNL